MDDLASIRRVADHFDLPLSTLHYWERRGLITPQRRFSHRYYDTDQIYRIALIRLWRTTGQMSLNEIAEVLSGRAEAPDWRDTVTARLSAIEAQMAQLDTARGYLRELLTCPQGDALERCGGFRAQVALPAEDHRCRPRH
ncbi:MerR family transcriptional regulator [Streptomyces kanamyceticus]|uniref:MerR family transcriptional regulator n=1 Tax=Streptomyces kanamyceticus TaxID=1967 RepID=A0A5J6G4T1_STRKN|nr:MerR family transcriptional regulator [Streptomyces kanamyceticus]QEU89943.1 MerR family transcriptional regulator [Streptomyces kanamyceticus]